jgi:hypothetical protein
LELFFGVLAESRSGGTNFADGFAAVFDFEDAGGVEFLAVFQAEFGDLENWGRLPNLIKGWVKIPNPSLISST